MELIEETLQTLYIPRAREKVQLSKPASKWKKPPDDTVKVNSDGAIRSESGFAASGVVVRRNTSFLGAICKSYQGISDLLCIEALALRDAVKYAAERDFHKVIFETVVRFY
jgi:hypothetical protein